MDTKGHGAAKPQPNVFSNHERHERARNFKPQNTLNTLKSLAAGLTIFYRLCLYIMNSEYRKVNSSGGSAVVIASRDAKDVMRKLVAIEKNLCEKTRK